MCKIVDNERFDSQADNKFLEDTILDCNIHFLNLFLEWAKKPLNVGFAYPDAYLSPWIYFCKVE